MTVADLAKRHRRLQTAQRPIFTAQELLLKPRA
jgi:hypothetical protein